MSETFRCPTCKAAVRVDAKFCGKCGRVFKPRGTFAPIENAPALNLATAPSSVAPEKRIGNYRIVGTWRRAEDFDARVYEVHARTIDDVPPRGLAIEEHQPLSSAMLKQFQALTPHPNLAAILDQSTDDTGNYFLIVEYVAGPLLNQLPVPAPDAAAVQLARELVLIVNDLNERGWGLQAARFWAAESLNRFQKAFALNAQGRLMLFDYTVLENLPETPRERAERIKRDVYWVAKTLYWLAAGEELGRKLEAVKRGESANQLLIRVLLDAIRDAQPALAKLAANLARLSV